MAGTFSAAAVSTNIPHPSQRRRSEMVFLGAPPTRNNPLRLRLLQNPPLPHLRSNRKKPSRLSYRIPASPITKMTTMMMLPLRSSSCRSGGGGVKRTLGVLCRSSYSNGSRGDAEEDTMALVEKKVVINVYPLSQRQREEVEAMRKSREILFREFCRHFGLSTEEVRAMWFGRRRGGGGGSIICRGDDHSNDDDDRMLDGRGSSPADEEMLGWVRGFLAEWGWRYQPLSPRSAMELLEEHIASSVTTAAAAGSYPGPAPRRPLLPARQ